jgi:oligosaccharide repeat unit polymerase
VALPAEVDENKITRLLSRWMPRCGWIHPLVIFWSVWAVTVGLYEMHFSELLIFSSSQVMTVVAWIVIPFTLTTLLYLAYRSWNPLNLSAFYLDTNFQIEKLRRRLSIAFTIWAMLTVVEIFLSGGLPILWLIQGSSKTYFDFGIPTFHGLLNSLLQSIGLISFALYALTRRRGFLWMPGFVIMWSIIVVTRNMLIVMLIECGVVWVMIRGLSKKTLTKAVIGVIALILVFGYIGDFRSGGAESFRGVAEPSQNYPEWLPSGALWVYIYMATPINNLVNTVQTTHPVYDPLFPYATSQLLPTVLRKIVYDPATVSELPSGDLVTEALNVSTAYLGPFRDFGMFGIACFSIILAYAAGHFWRDRSLRGSLAYAILAQCVILSIFFNHLFYLPIITQVLWLYVFLPNHKPMPKRWPSHDLLSEGEGTSWNASS